MKTLAFRWEVEKDGNAAEGFRFTLIRKNKYEYRYSPNGQYPRV